MPPESVLPDIDWKKLLGSEGNIDFYTTDMFKGKPLKVFVTTKEVKIKKEKVEKVELPIAQSSEKEESDKHDSDLSRGSSGQGENKLIELMNKLTPELLRVTQKQVEVKMKQNMRVTLVGKVNRKVMARKLMKKVLLK